jgi:ABC-2 type transport system ATP-binding protein
LVSAETESGQNEEILSVTDLTVRYGRRVAVDGLSLSLAAGEVVALLGPNGAGKSTALMAIAGALMPAAGTIRVAGADLGDDPLVARAHIGFADQPPSLYEFFTVAEHLAFVGETRGDRDAEAQRGLLHKLGIAPIADRLCRELSFGMRQRVGLAAALVGDVRVVLLDETLNGLDPRAAKAAREVVGEVAAAGAGVLMSTHLLGVAERLCDRIIIMDAGVIKVDIRGDELAAVLDGGPGAVEQLYLEHVTSEEVHA